jgi:dolichol-phosphate mannosyltransferase
MKKISFIIPAYNEAECVAHTAQALQPVLEHLSREYSLEVVFVDDGSSDSTYDLLQQHFGHDARVRVVQHEQNRGLGAAIRTGFSHATGEIIVTTDFDGTYPFARVSDLLALMTDEVDIVTASPYHPDGGVEGVPRYRLLFSFGASLLYRILVNWHIHTWTALFRAYRRSVVETISFESDDFLAGTELLVYAQQAGFRIVEFPTVLHQRAFGQSSIKIARVTWAHLRFQFHILLSYLRNPFRQPMMRKI